MDNYKLLHKIGSGNYADVFLAQNTKTGQQVSGKPKVLRNNCDMVSSPCNSGSSETD